MKKKYTCPCCGADISSMIAEIQRDHLAKIAALGGSRQTAKKAAAQKRNIVKLNAHYTAEKRKAAAEKRKATLAAKKDGR